MRSTRYSLPSPPGAHGVCGHARGSSVRRSGGGVRRSDAAKQPRRSVSRWSGGEARCTAFAINEGVGPPAIYFGSFTASRGESTGIYSFTPGRPSTDSQMVASAA